MRYLFFICFSIFIFSCNYKSLPENLKTKKELLLYCGETMAPAIFELKTVFEKQENVKIRTISGGSGILKRTIEQVRLGDLFFPGKEKYVLSLKKENFIKSFRSVGFNQAVILVEKNNPKHIHTLEDLLKKDVRFAIGNPDFGSIGKETAKILKQKNLYNKFINKAKFLAVDSKLLKNALINHRVDAIINWKAVAFYKKTKNKFEIIPLNSKKRRLTIAVLTTSKYPKIALKFLDFISSKKGEAILRKYGFKN